MRGITSTIAADRLEVLEDPRQPHVVVARDDGIERPLRALAVGQEIKRQEQRGHGPSEGRQHAGHVAHESGLEASEPLLQSRVLHGASERGRELALLEQDD